MVQRQFARAIRPYKAALRYDPGSNEALNTLALLVLHSGDLDRAEKLIDLYNERINCRRVENFDMLAMSQFVNALRYRFRQGADPARIRQQPNALQFPTEIEDFSSP